MKQFYPPQSLDRFTFDLQRFAFSGGDGSKDNPYKISSVADLQQLATDVNGGTNYSGKYFKQTQDITFTEADGNFTAIGNYDNPFRGTFDGGNFTIENLKISGGDCQGLFGYVDSVGTVKDVHLVNADISGNNHVGGLVGLNKGTVSGTTSDSSVHGTNNNVGGLVGLNHGTVIGNTSDSSVSGKYSVGGLVGWNDGGTVSGSSINNSVSDGGRWVGYNDGTFTPLYALTLPEGISATYTGDDDNKVTLYGKTYYKTGATFTITVTNETEAKAELEKVTGGLQANGVDLTFDNGTYSVTIGDSDVKVGYAGFPKIAGLTFDTTNNTYTIDDKDDLQALANYVKGGGDTSGLTFNLAANIEGVDFHIGTSSNNFAGTLDGNSNKITVSYTSTTNDCALFNYVDGATIQALTVNGTINTSTQYAAGIAAHAYGSTTITDCVSSVTINSTKSGDGTHGGFVSVVEGGTTSITNSIFKGKLRGQYTHSCGGFVGYNAGTLNIDDCIFAPTELTIGKTNSANFARNADFDPESNKDTLTNSYYTQTFGEAQGAQIYTLTLPTGVTASGNGVIEKFGNYYATAGSTITFSGLDENSYFRGSDSHTRSNNTYTMPAMDSTLTEPDTISSNIDGTEVTLKFRGIDEKGNSCYEISSVNDLKVLAAYVNDGHNCEGLTFKQTESITFQDSDGNFTPIGNLYYFKGTYDGRGFTIKNLKINSTEYCQGLFGYVDIGGTVQDVHLVNANVSGNNYTGGLVGSNSGSVSGTITDSTVSGNYRVGGLVGANHGGTVSGIVTGGTVTGTSNDVGGLVGYTEGKMTVSGTTSYSKISGNSYVGGLVGRNQNRSSTVSGNTTNNEVSGTYYVGGLVGVNHGTVSGNTSDSSVSGNNSVGGLVGSNDEGSAIGNTSDNSVKGSTLFGEFVGHKGSGTATQLYALILPAKGISYTCTNASDYEVTIYGKTYYKSGATFTISVDNETEAKEELHNPGDTLLANGVALTSENGTYSVTIGDSDVKVGYAGYPKIAGLNFDGATDTYTIDDKDDLQALATYVNNGGDTSGLTFKLTANIEGVDFHIGTSSNNFAGTLDGNSNKITVSYTSTTNDCALFNYVDGATIQDLTVNGEINTSAKYAAGIAAHAFGTTNITNCTSSVTINSTVSGEGTHGGFVSVVEGGTTSITNSIFKGELLGSSTNSCGGFVGRNGGSLNITDSIFAPQELTIGTNNSATFARGTAPNLSGDVYYTKSFGDAQNGTKLSTLTLPEGITTDTQPDFTIDSVGYYFSGTKINLNGVNGYFKGSDGKFVVNNTYTMPAMDSTLTEPDTISANIDSTEVTLKFRGIDEKGNGCYEISSVNDLKVLAAYINGGHDGYGLTFKLTANIEGVDFHIGTSDNKFKGTLNGNSHKITVDYTSTTENCALFNYVDGATIQDLTVNGEINTSAKYAAGIVAQTSGTTTIENCRSSVTINSTIPAAQDGTASDGTHGGFVAVNGGTLNISNSIFDGKLLGSSTDRCGGFVGWNSGTLNINSSIFAPSADITIGTNNSATFARGTAPNLEDGCYYTQAFGSAQGSQVYKLTLPTGVIATGDIVVTDGDKTYAAGNITLVAAEGYTLKNIMVNGTLDDDGVFTVDSDTNITADVTSIVEEDNTFNAAGTGVIVNGTSGDFHANSTLYSITASQQNSTLIANAKNNTVIIAGGGENILTGGTGNDSFKFSAGGGIVTDYGIGATKNGDDTATTANGVDIVKVDGKVNGIYFERDGNTKKTATFTATIVYGDNNDVIVLKDIVKKPTKTGSSPIYQTNDIAAATLKIWDTSSGSKQSVLSAAKLKKLFHDDNDDSFTEILQSKTDYLVKVSEGITPATNPFEPQIALNSNTPQN